LLTVFDLDHIIYVQSLSDYLGSKPFLMGSEPTTVDCTMYGMVLQMVVGVREDCVYRHLLPF
jgi:hypothetical protein